MKQQFWTKFLSGFLSLVLVFSMILFSPSQRVEAAPVDPGQVEITSNTMSVVMDEFFPRVIEYRWGSTGKVMYGQSTVLTDVLINSTRYRPTVTSSVSANQIDYSLDFSGAGLAGVILKMRFTVTDNILEMRMTEIVDPSGVVRYIEFPSQSLVSVRSTQAGAAMAYNANFANGDTFSTVSAAAINASAKKIGHVFLYTDELAAAIESDMTCQYNNIQTVNKGSYKETGMWTADFMYRGPDKSVTALPWCKIAITDDCNEDGQVNWQDAAVMYRKIMDPLSGDNLARKTIAVNILLNYWGRQSWTWENGLDYVKRQALATDNFPQIMLVKGAHNQFGDGWPSYGDANPLLGGNDALRRLIEEGAKYNVYVGTHTNSVEAYPESPFYEETPKYNGGVWDFVDRGGTAVDDIAYWSTGLLDQRYEAHKAEFPGMKFQYLDVSAGRWDGKEARWTTWKTLQKFQEMDWTYFTEMYLGYVNYTLNDTSTNALSPKYVNWCHTYFYGGENNGGNHGNSNIRRFIINDQAIYEAGSQEYQNVLGAGYEKSYGYLGWSEAQTTVTGAVNEFWQHTLADTYLKNFPILSINNDASNNNYLTARFTDGVQSVYDGSKRTISKNGIVYAELNDNVQDIFIPWEATTEDKIYTYRSTGGSRTWQLPASWSAVTEVSLYAMDQVSGKTLVDTIGVSNGKVTINYEAGQGYVLTKSSVTQPETIWGDGSPIKDGNFNSTYLNYWTAEDAQVVSVKRNTTYDNLYLKIDGESKASQQVNNLEAGKDYVITALAYTPDSRTGSLSVVNGSQTIAANFTGANFQSIMGNCFNNWTLLKAHFTAQSQTVTVNLNGLAGNGAVYFDDVRFYEETNPYGAQGHYYYDDLETSHMMGAFVHQNGEMGRLAYANNGVNQVVQIDGQRSILMSGRYETIIKTTPGSLKLEPNTGYDLKFTFKSSYGSADGWKYTIISPSTGQKLVNQYISGYEGEVVRESISFKTDDKTDYILVFTNAFALSTSKSDLAFDDLTLDINPAAVNPELMPDDYKPKEGVLVEAESGKVNGSAMAVQDANASGGYAVSSFQTGDTIQYDYMSAAQRLRIKYKSTLPQQLQLIVNGVEQSILELPATSDGYENISFNVSFPSACTVILKAIQADTLFLDLLELSPVYEAETASPTGYTGHIDDPLASGGKLVWLNDQNRQNTKLSFPIIADATTLTIRYANEKSSDRLLDIYLNGTAIKTGVAFPYTGPRSGSFVFAEMSFPINLAVGDVLELRAPAGVADVALIDCIMTSLDETKVASKVELDKASLEFNGEVSQQLAAIVSPETAEIKSVAWSSDNPQVATVRNGQVIPTGVGTTKIRVSLSSGKSSASCQVEVKSMPHQGDWVEAESGTSGINGYVTGRTSSVAGETLTWMNSTNWSTGVPEYSYWSYTVSQDADGIMLRYANQLSIDRVLSLQVNGDTVINGMTFGKTGSSGIVCAETLIPITLKKGDILRFTVPLGETNGLMIDKFAYVLGTSLSSLQALVDQAAALESSAYTQDSWQALGDAQTEAQAIIDQGNPANAEIAAAMDKLWTALDGLELRDPVSIQDLQDVYDQVEALLADSYTASSWAPVEAALASAKGVLDNPSPSQKNIFEAYDRLNEAITGLVLRGDTTVLAILVDLYSQIISEEALYTPGTWQVFNQAYTEAKALVDDPTNASETNVSAAQTALEDAVDNLQMATDKTPVQVLLTQAQAILAGDTSIFITHWVENLRSAVVDAEALMANDAATDQDVLDMAIRLNQAISSMFEKGNSTALIALVAAAERLQAVRFTPDSWNLLAPVLEAAKAVLQAESDQEEIDTAWQNLSQVISQLKLRANFSRLLSAIGTAENIWQNKDRYVPTSIAGLEAGLNQAKIVRDNLNSTQDEVNQMTESLLGITSQARFKAQKDALKAALDQATALDLGIYTTVSANRLTIAILKGQAMIANPDATQGEVDASVKSIENAMNALKKKATPPVPPPPAVVDKERLGAVLSQTSSPDRSLYTPESLTTLDDTRSLGQSYMESDSVSQSDVDNCAEAILAAWRGLTLLSSNNKDHPPVIEPVNNNTGDAHYYRPAQEAFADNNLPVDKNKDVAGAEKDLSPNKDNANTKPDLSPDKDNSNDKPDLSKQDPPLSKVQVAAINQIPWPMAMGLGLLIGLIVAAAVYGVMKRKKQS